MLKQTTQNQRALFLKLFTQEILLSMKKQIQEKKAEKQTIEKPREIFSQSVEIKEEKRTRETELTKPFEIEKTKIFQKSRLQPVILQNKPIQQYTKPISQPPTSLQERVFKPRFAILRDITGPANQQAIGLSSQASGETKEMNLGKLNMLLRDKAITMIECPGPEKPILIKRINQLNITKVSLSQQEINNIIEEFSKKARIPIIGGVFRASVSNLTISAVISEFVGSRFIITKSSPYNLIEQKTQQTPQRQQTGQSLPLQKFPQKFQQSFQQPQRFTQKKKII